MPLISIVTPTFNEELNIEKLCAAVRDVMQNNTFDYEHIIIDNCSTDTTTRIVKDLIAKDKKIKLIINNKNYGHLNSPIYGLLQSKGDASILLNSDFQDPPELIDQLLSKWKNGSKIVLLQKTDSDENTSMKLTRNFFYWFLKKISKTPLTVNTTGSGLFDKSILNEVKKLNDPCPYFRGIVADIGPEIDLLKFKQPVRLKGETKNNFFSLMDMAILAIVKHSKAPLRLMTILGFIISFLSISTALIFFILKLIYWDSFDFGTAPLLIGIFSIGGFQILFLGLLGEYIGTILSHVRNLPLVIEKERVNFD